jgi:carbon storage regulator
MLVLSRKLGEELVIGSDIRITVTYIGEGRVKIGIDAPKWVRVDRAEVAERIQAAHSLELATG